MVFLILVSVLFEDPLPLLYWWAVSVGGEELKWRQLKQSANWASKASPTLGCSIEISRDIYYVGMCVCLSYVKLTAAQSHF